MRKGRQNAHEQSDHGADEDVPGPRDLREGRERGGERGNGGRERLREDDERHRRDRDRHAEDRVALNRPPPEYTEEEPAEQATVGEGRDAEGDDDDGGLR